MLSQLLHLKVAHFFTTLFGSLYHDHLQLTHEETMPVLNVAAKFSKDIQKKWTAIRNGATFKSKKLFEKDIGIILDFLQQRLNKDLDRWNLWWNGFVKASRVFCVAEEHDNLLMWAHYANDHQGAVIKFECLRELDKPLCVARPIRYVDDPPVIANLDEYVYRTTGQGNPSDNYDDLYEKMVTSKSTHWSYEKEWRVIIPPDNIQKPSVPTDSSGEEVLYKFVNLHPKEIHSIYFGSKMKDNEKQNIEKLLTDDFAHVEKYQCIRHEKQYSLVFEKC